MYLLLFHRGSKIFPAFVKYLKSKDASDGSEEALAAELKSFDEYLKANVIFSTVLITTVDYSMPSDQKFEKVIRIPIAMPVHVSQYLVMA